MTIITLTTDFGLADGYVAAVKGVILEINPDVKLVDITHDITPHSIHHAAYVLMTATPYFPPGTIHLVVVDPGVGGPRRPIAVRAGTAFFVGPDNGVFSYVLQKVPPDEVTIVHLTRPFYWRVQVSATFHGRDIFAPVAAHLSLGIPITELGDLITDPVTLPEITPERKPDGTVVGHVIHVDRFGNVITNVSAHDLPDSTALRIGLAGRWIDGLSRSYSDVEPGHPVALFGSADLLEIAVREGHAARTFGVRIGDPVTIVSESREKEQER